jgi:hypothetical protein
MTREEAVEILREDKTLDWDKFGFETIQDFNKAFDEAYEMAIKALQEEPQRAKGHLISNQQNREVKPFWERYRCSICGEYAQDNFNYCSRCGAELEGEEE